MIASVRGKVIRKGMDYLVVEAVGVGYKISVPVSIIESVKVEDDCSSLPIRMFERIFWLCTAFFLLMIWDYLSF